MNRSKTRAPAATLSAALWASCLPGCASSAITSDDRSIGPAHVMTCEQYARVRHDTPYILQCARGGGRMIYYGARHVYDPADAQVQDIERFWNAFRPKIALNEGGDPPVASSRDEAVRRYGEAGLVRWLAARDGVPVTTFEPARQAEANDLLTQFSVEQVKVFYALRAVWQDGGRSSEARATSAETLVDGVLSWYGELRGLELGPLSSAEFVAACKRLLPAGADWRRPQPEWFDPVPRGGNVLWTSRLARRASEFRDRHIVERLLSELKPGQRVFAVIGASHVVMQEPALRRCAEVVRRRKRHPGGGAWSAACASCEISSSHGRLDSNLARTPAGRDCRARGAREDSRVSTPRALRVDRTAATLRRRVRCRVRQASSAGSWQPR